MKERQIPQHNSWFLLFFVLDIVAYTLISNAILLTTTYFPQDYHVLPFGRHHPDFTAHRTSHRVVSITPQRIRSILFRVPNLIIITITRTSAAIST